MLAAGIAVLLLALVVGLFTREGDPTAGILLFIGILLIIGSLLTQ